MTRQLHSFQKNIPGHKARVLLLLLGTGIILFFVLISPLSFRATNLSLVEGQVSPQDIQAPSDLEYISEVRTDQARDLAERGSLPVYSNPDQSIARKQLDQLRQEMDGIDVIREINNLPIDLKSAKVREINGIALSDSEIESLLIFSDQRWESVRAESLRLLEQVLRSQVRDENIEIKITNLSSDVSLVLTEEQSAVVVGLVSPLIVANSFFSPEQTDLSRQQARLSIEPVTQTYMKGEFIVQRGRVITAANIEALERFNLIKAADPYQDYVGAAAIIAVLMAFIGIYFHRNRPSYYYEFRSLVLISLLLIIFTLLARVVIPNRTILPYVFPLPAFALLIATLFGSGAGIVFSILIAILVPFNTGAANDLSIFYLVTSILGVVSLGKGYRIGSFLWSAIVLSFAGIGVITAYKLSSGGLDLVGYSTLLAATLLNGIASASMAMLMQYFLAEFFGLTTGLRLLEISRSDAPLLKHFLRTAPGTYQHSLMVANLVEQAAEKLGLDPLLVRVGALYHDVGKTINPAFFIENQLPTNLDPHDEMDPEIVAQMVIQHVLNGRVLAQKYRLPSRIIDFIMEHHGTLTARYLYNRALNAVDGDLTKIDIGKYQYPGPAPRSKETALLMLADNVEARTRSEKPTTETEIAKVVEKAIDFCQKEDQLSNTRFTLKDISDIKEAFITTLTGLYHPRIAYPNNEPKSVGT